MMEYKNIIFETTGAIGTITINRPEVRNALSPETWQEIRDAFSKIRIDEKIKVVILTGSGEKCFASGADLKVLKDKKALDCLNNEINNILMEIEYFKKPVIAAINGYALGGGCELAMACDIRIASKNAKFGQPEVNLGIIPGMGGTQRLVKLVGIGKAKELIFTGAIIDAEEAKNIGLVNKVVDSDKLLEEAQKMAQLIAKKGPVALEVAKTAINISNNVDTYSGLLFERYAQTITFGTNDKSEGISAFLEKRKPDFKGD